MNNVRNGAAETGGALLSLGGIGRRAMSLAEQIAQQVAEAIVQEELAAGQAITEQSLSDSFSVSRGPVREALRILEKEGLVEIVPRHGARVTRLTLDEVKQVFELRAILLGYCAARAAENKGGNSLAVLKGGRDGLVANLKGEDSLQVHMSVSADMNEELVRASGNERIMQLVHHLARQTARYTRLGLSSTAAREKSVKSWSELIDLIEAGKVREAELLERSRVVNVRLHASELIKEAGQHPTDLRSIAKAAGGGKQDATGRT